jgi:hypothetical protein
MAVTQILNISSHFKHIFSSLKNHKKMDKQSLTKDIFLAMERNNEFIKKMTESNHRLVDLLKRATELLEEEIPSPRTEPVPIKWSDYPFTDLTIFWESLMSDTAIDFYKLENKNFVKIDKHNSPSKIIEFPKTEVLLFLTLNSACYIHYCNYCKSLGANPYTKSIIKKALINHASCLGTISAKKIGKQAYRCQVFKYPIEGVSIKLNFHH